ncbi:pyridoxine 5' phosphate oxidase [Trichuris trichiura]|uniref:Pyridoxine-5'-phosphate oxidase n=1 Tax=Trichuris trichiura TaxID=36087 RepID=A0A077ZEE3_TRITR|nr:pyridoxine 5' phosphate oxidase [Trichuris trichiura]
MRKPYGNKTTILLEDQVKSKEPMGMFDSWFKELRAVSNIGYEEVNAMALSTVGRDGKPSCRPVLLKAYSQAGFTFYSSTNSRKGKEMKDNPNVCLTFYWPSMNRTVRVEGTVEIISDSEADTYWNSRPVQSQASAYASYQSSVVPSRQYLEERAAKVKRDFTEKGLSIPRPTTWVGYLVKPAEVEFWQGQSDRLHDRLRFRRRQAVSEHDDPPNTKDTWIIERLSP